MIDHGLVQATEKPKRLEITETKVFMYENFGKVEIEDEEGTREEWQFSMKEYDKDEFIELMNRENDKFRELLYDTQLALTEVYEMLEV